MVLALALALPSCARRETPVALGNRQQILHRGIGAEPAELDPQLVTNTSAISVVSALFEGLVAEDPRDLHPIPGIAERWEVSPDGLTYTFYLRPTARWSDGRPVTAADFVFSWRRILTPSFAADNAELLFVLQGAEAYYHGVIRDFSEVGVLAVSPRVLRVTLEHPASYFLTLLAHWAWYPVPEKSILSRGSPYDRGNPWARPPSLVGDGPFSLVSWVPEEEIIVRKSPTYWNAGRVRLNEIHFYPIENLEAEERSFRAGQLHLTDSLPTDRIEADRREMPECYRADPYLMVYFLRCNTRRPYLSDSRIRRALSLAIDRRAIAEKVLLGTSTPAESFTPPGMDGYDPPALAATDLARARRLLADAGYPGGAGLPPFDFLYYSSEKHRQIAEAIQAMWGRGLGIRVNLVNQEAKVTLAERRTGDYQILRSDWLADYPNPRSFLDVWRSDSGNNYTGWANPDYDALLFAADRTPDPAERHRLWARAETLLLDEAPIIPIAFYRRVFLIRPSVRGWYPNLLDRHPYADVWLKP